MFVREYKCTVCGKPMKRKRGICFKHRVDEHCGDGYCSYNKRDHVCNACLGVLKDMMRERINRPTLTVTLDEKEMIGVVMKEMKNP